MNDAGVHRIQLQRVPVIGLGRIQLTEGNADVASKIQRIDVVRFSRSASLMAVIASTGRPASASIRA